MNNWIPSFSRHTVSEEFFKTDHKVIRLESRALAVRFPFGGFVWNRPTAVQIEEDGNQTRQPIVDITRISILSFWVIGLFFISSGMIIAARFRRSTTEERHDG